MDEAVKAWRREQRTSLLAMRQAMPPEARQRATRTIAARLDDFVKTGRYTTIGLYWPIKHEINLLPWAEALARRSGVVLCMPVVVAREAPIEYWRWRQGE